MGITTTTEGGRRIRKKEKTSLARRDNRPRSSEILSGRSFRRENKVIWKQSMGNFGKTNDCSKKTPAESLLRKEHPCK